ncbi:MAG TPA: hypothetical protein VFA91_04890, partial [Candidatus Polarisedimenticolia bacterium]|nr:hypothetical protein [Candidatus Polarisedimenticolia bacterium]
MTADLATLYHQGLCRKEIAAKLHLRDSQAKDIISALMSAGSLDRAAAKEARQKRRGTDKGMAAYLRARRARLGMAARKGSDDGWRNRYHD